MDTMKMNLPEDVQFIISRLNEKGYEAFAVGGCVRDMLLNKTPKDWDITTSAPPEKVKEIFDKTYDTGIKHGTVTVLRGKVGYEVTTYRIDGGYDDCRHPTEVYFTDKLEEDLKRRDFTINAMAYHPIIGLRDPLEGRIDLNMGLIRGVGDAAKRFQEDALRMLRALRFSAQLGFEIEEGTMTALRENKQLIQKISRERIKEELDKLLTADSAEKVPMLWMTGLLHEIFPKLSQILEGRGKELSLLLPRAEKNLILCWSLFLYHYPKEEIPLLLKELHFDTASLRRIQLICIWSDKAILPQAYELRKAAYETGIEAFLQILQFHCILGTKGAEEAQGLFQQILENKDCILMKDLNISGNDLIELGVPKGERVGRLLQLALDEVHKKPSCNQKETLLRRIYIEVEEQAY